jgi:hypothetical protein
LAKGVIRLAALRLAELGFRVLPLDGKKPLTLHGVCDASSDARQIRRWWQKHPRANVGIAGGGGIVIVDVDSGRRVDFPATVEARTGRGRHLFFRTKAKLGNTARRLASDIDTRGEGGYVVAAPSVHPSGKLYLWTRSPWRFKMAELPKAIEDKLTPSVRCPEKTPVNVELGNISGQRTEGGDFSRSGIDRRNLIRWVNEGKTKEECLELFAEHSEKYAERGDRYFEYVWNGIERPVRGQIVRVGIDKKPAGYHQIWFYVDLAGRLLRGRLVVPDEEHTRAWKRWRAVAPELDPAVVVTRRALVYNLVGRLVDVVVRDGSIAWIRAC